MEIDGKDVRVTHPEKVLYPSTGTTKGDVIAYYNEVAPYLIAYAADRPATRKRWVHGVGTEDAPGEVFFQKELGNAPDWIPRQVQHHKDHDVTYPLVNDAATLTWLAQMAALEIHVPQWRFNPDGEPGNPDRMVFDLDPGEGAGLPECVEVAGLVRKIVEGMGLELVPVTSGSKGIHVYAPLDGSHTSAQINDLAHELARSIEADSDLVISTMRKVDRRGKVLIDWSQNNANKTTIAPYSLRGRRRPTVAMPRTWREIGSPHLRQIEFNEVGGILARRGDAARPLLGRDEAAAAAGDANFSGDDKEGEPDRLTVYRSMRSAAATPEPVPDLVAARESATAPIFVIQKHAASRLHYDFRLEHDGVLVSWALPKGVPSEGNHLAVHVEDHPIEYATFAGDIPKGQYGAGHVDVWDHGTFEGEWSAGEVVATLHGQPDGGLGGDPVKVALISAHLSGQEKNWLIHRMEPEGAGERPTARPPRDATDHRADARSARPAGEPRPAETRPADARSARPAGEPRPAETRPADARSARPAATGSRSAGGRENSSISPMLATLGTADQLRQVDADAADWAIEMKWDGIRAIAAVGKAVDLRSRNGIELDFPEFADLPSLLDGRTAVLDGEIIALDARGYPSFGLLQRRSDPDRPRPPIRYVVFDLLALDGQDLTDLPYTERHSMLLEHVATSASVLVPPVFEGSAREGMDRARELHLEGILAKKRASAYAAGRRSKSWLKFKFHRTQEVVIVGWRPGKRKVGSLLLGVNDGGALRYVGRVGTGFSDADAADFAARLRPLARKTSPAADVPKADASDANWVSPQLVGEVEFAEWTGDGRLRQASWRGWRPDKDPEDVVREE
ncbi:ATP-dependent DNA ligase [Rarobacter faecitabidus]|uniref:DNA ligase (ATP) n=1 Tax=Rarobacter faecitabidus TaxID=13243 RepID=A0A542ZP25_RARFA|nr:ATP-dependent DNA ligase [Rarobacter faecitabidus]TQL62067.1 ATP-dependent DNA ligase LigD ligase module /ATP-dependent DNA ligase LigD phosphoesterase module /ATP-dependent DNA ligase LigD polymerase module [Rarobacter faecitabidus]